MNLHGNERGWCLDFCRWATGGILPGKYRIRGFVPKELTGQLLSLSMMWWK
jgi:hypothetical protein